MFIKARPLRARSQAEFDAHRARWNGSGLLEPDRWRRLLAELTDEPDLAVQLQQYGWTCDDVENGLAYVYDLLGFEHRSTASPEALVALFDVIVRLHDAHRAVAKQRLRAYRSALSS